MKNRSSYLSYIQFYLVLFATCYKLYEAFQLQFIPGLNTAGLIILVLLLSRIKFLQISEDCIVVTNPLGIRSYTNKKDVKEVKRIYSQICILRLVDGTRVFFIQKFFHAVCDVFFEKDKYLNNLLK